MKNNRPKLYKKNGKYKVDFYWLYLKGSKEPKIGSILSETTLTNISYKLKGKELKNSENLAPTEIFIIFKPYRSKKTIFIQKKLIQRQELKVIQWPFLMKKE